MADENDTSQSASVNGKNSDGGAPCEEPQWVSMLQPDLLELDKHTLSTLQSLPPGTIVLEPGKFSIPGSADVVASDGDNPGLHGFYLRPVMLNDNQNDIPTVFARLQDRGLDNNEPSGSNPELSLVSFRDGGNAELCESDNKNANHVSISNRGDLEGALRLDGSLLIKDDNLNDHQAVDASWGQEPNPVILLPKTEGDIMVDVGVRVQNDPWLATFEDNGLQKSPSGRVLEAVPEELSPLVDGGGEKIGDYLEAEDHEGGNSSPPQITVSEEFKVPKTEPGIIEATEENIIITSAAKITTRSDSEGSNNLPHQKGTYLSHLPVKKRKMDNNFTVANSRSQLVSAESVPQVSMVAVSSIASPLVLPASSMTASSLLLSALTAVPKSGKNSGAGLTTGLCVNTATGLLEPIKSSSNILKLVSGTGQPGKVGSPMTVVMTSLPADGAVAATAMTSATEDHQESRTGVLPCADNPNFMATFCCTYCQAELETWEQAQSHKFTHQLESSPGTFFVRYLCTPCGASFDTWEDAQDHSADNAAMPLVTCNVCSCLVPANNMYDHITRHTKQTPEKLSTKLAVQVLKLQKDEANLNLTPQSKNANSFASSSSSSSSSTSSASSSSNSSSLEHLPLSKKLELQTALLQADIKRFRVLRKTIKKVQKQSSSSSTSSSSSSSAPAAASSPSMLTKGPGNP